MRGLITTAFLVACMAPLPAHAENWQPLVGEDNLRDLVSGSTAEIEVKPGVIAVGKYYADGSAEIEAWNETFRRAWLVEGDDQVCYSDVETNCFTFEQNVDDLAEFRARNVQSGEVVTFQVMNAEGQNYSAAKTSDDDGGLGSPSAAEVAAALSDPNTNLGTLNTQVDYIAYAGDIPGASSADATRMLFQPSLPYKLSDTTNLFIRPAIPVIFRQDVPQAGGDFSAEGIDLGDISFDAAVGKTLSGGIVLLAGVAGTLPTATNDSLGLDQWLLGPEFAVAKVGAKGVVGVLLSHQWDVAGEDEFDTSITAGQYFYTLNLKDGWQLNGAPTFSYNHEATSGNKWTFPLAIGVTKTTFIGGRPWKFGVQYWHYLESPDNFGPDFQIRFIASPVVKLPW